MLSVRLLGSYPYYDDDAMTAAALNEDALAGVQLSQ